MDLPLNDEDEVSISYNIFGVIRCYEIQHVYKKLHAKGFRVEVDVLARYLF